MSGCPTARKRSPLAEVRESGVGGLLVYRADHRCSPSIATNGDRWPDDVRLSDIAPRFIWGKRYADVRPDFNCNRCG
jgi:hypothetical protein